MVLTIGHKAIKIDKTSFFGVSANEFDFKPTNWIATEFASFKAIRDFWNEYRVLIIEAAK